jgi:hypothetical protein
MQLLDDLEEQRRQQAETNRKLLHPAILKFAQECRRVFGSGVRLYPRKRWPGGSR